MSEKVVKKIEYCQPSGSNGELHYQHCELREYICMYIYKYSLYIYLLTSVKQEMKPQLSKALDAMMPKFCCKIYIVQQSKKTTVFYGLSILELKSLRSSCNLSFGWWRNKCLWPKEEKETSEFFGELWWVTKTVSDILVLLFTISMITSIKFSCGRPSLHSYWRHRGTPAATGNPPSSSECRVSENATNEVDVQLLHSVEDWPKAETRETP